MGNVYVVSTVRTPVGKAKKGAFVNVRPDDLAATAMQEALKRVEGFDPAELEDIIMGCAMPEGEQGMNVGRIAQMRAGIPDSVPALTINRFCASGLQAIAFGADRIKNGDADAILAGGLETMSMIPMGGNKIAPNPYLVDNRPETYINMGLTAEKVADKYNISREDQDIFALESNNRALKAIKEGRFEEEIVPVQVTTHVKNGRKVDSKTITVSVDEGPRASDLAGLAKLRPAFREGGSVTAGNSSQMSDGAAATVLMSEKKVEELGVKPLARFVDFATAGCSPEIMGIGPALAIPKLLKKANLQLEDIGLIELNEAFAAQSLMVIRDLGLNPDIVNVNGGAIALGHPLGCTGAKLTATLVYEMKRRNVKYGIVSMCVGGGMGAAGLFELVS